MEGSTTTGAETTGAVTSSTTATPTTSGSTGEEASTGSPPGATTTGVTPGTSTSSTGAGSTTDGGTTGEAPPCCLAPAEPTSTVKAVTPIGARTLPWATLSESGGECGGTIYMDLFPDVTSIGVTWAELDGVDSLRIAASRYMDMWPDDFLGTGPVSIEARFGGQVAMTTGEITILEFVPEMNGAGWCAPESIPYESDARVVFTISLQADGWDIAGEVLAAYCPSLNVLCP